MTYPGNNQPLTKETVLKLLGHRQPLPPEVLYERRVEAYRIMQEHKHKLGSRKKTWAVCFIRRKLAECKALLIMEKN